MCRHLAYLGSPVVLHDLLFGAPHALRDQACTPRHQSWGDTNPDGWGVGWYVEGRRVPEHYRTVTPIWDDVDFCNRSHTIRSGALVAAARSASPGAAIEPSGNAPFRSGPWLFSLNGYVHDFREGVGDELRARLTHRRRAGIEGDSDSEVLFALALDRLDAGDGPHAALSHVAETVLGLAKGRLNMLLTDGPRVAATRFGNSLFVRERTVASEPLDDDPGWHEVADESVFVV